MLMNNIEPWAGMRTTDECVLSQNGSRHITSGRYKTEYDLTEHGQANIDLSETNRTYILFTMLNWERI